MKLLKYSRVAMLISMFALMVACSYDVKHVQYSLAVRPSSEDKAILLRAAVKNFANAEGWTKMTQAGNEEYLEKQGRYLHSFAAHDGSYISITNLANVGCYDIGVHSGVSPKAAKEVGERLRQQLNIAIQSDIKAESNCSTL
jgi:hypothetical protein